MNSIILETFRHPSARSLTPRRKAQCVTGKTRTTGGKSGPESRLWKLTSTVISPVKPGSETSLFLIASLAGIGAIIYSIDQLVTFIHSDALAHAITALRFSF
jgi:hypothetical protein